jgi:hypothetical protein
MDSSIIIWDNGEPALTLLGHTEQVNHACSFIIYVNHVHSWIISVNHACFCISDFIRFLIPLI